MIDASEYSGTGLIPLGTLGTGSTEVVNTQYSKDAWVGLKGTAGDTFALEGSLDNTANSYDNMDVNDSSITINASGIGRGWFEGKLPPYLRVTRVAGTGTTTIQLLIGAVS